MPELGQRTTLPFYRKFSSVKYTQHRADCRRLAQTEHPADERGDHVLSTNVAVRMIVDHVASPTDLPTVNE
jgi:hypothetical protein